MSFSRILGQQRAKQFLTMVMARERLPHAYLFTGIPGIGKTTTAIALAMVLNCREPRNDEGCGRCASCRQLIGGNFPDFLSIRPQGQNIRIDQIRDLNRTLSFAPVFGRYRVSVIYQAERMTAEAANSFLKTLEEPPPGNILILNATEPLDLPPTIVSRCQRVSFQPLSIQDMTNWLVNERGLEEGTAVVLAKISTGSLGHALKMCEAGFVDKRQEWLLRLIKLPSLSEEEALEMALECVKEDGRTGFDALEPSGAGLTDMLAIWETWYRDLLVLRVGGPTHLLINADLSHELKNFAGNSSIQNLRDSVFIVDRAQRDLRQMRNTKLVMEHIVLRLKQLAVRPEFSRPKV